MRRVLIFVVLLSGCGPSADTDAGTANDAGREGCDPACGEDELCTDGECVPRGCESDGECDDGFVCNGAESCDARACVAGVPVADGTACAEGMCLATPDPRCAPPVCGDLLRGPGEDCDEGANDDATDGCHDCRFTCASDADCVLTLAPSAADYDAAFVGEPSPEGITFTLNNEGDVPSGPISIRLAGANPDDFVIENDVCSSRALGVSLVCRFDVRFDPTYGGERQALLVVSGMPGGTVTSELRGTGLGEEALFPVGAHRVALSADGARAIAGARLEELGAARIFVRTGSRWTQETALYPTDPGEPYFGAGVALSADGSLAIVGMPDEGPTESWIGSVRIFERTESTWAPAATLSPPEGADPGFGAALAISADGARVIVGASGVGNVAKTGEAGGAHIFVREGASWTWEASLESPSPRGGALFGYALALDADGTRALVGSPWRDDPESSGIAYLFSRTGTSWDLLTTLTSPGAGELDVFGMSVALQADGTRALVGRPGDTTSDGLNAGAAVVFTETGAAWESATLIAPNGDAGDEFGLSVALSSDGNIAIFGAPLDYTFGNEAGNAYLFLRDDDRWVQDRMLRASSDTRWLGSAVALSADGRRAIVASYATTHVFRIAP